MRNVGTRVVVLVGLASFGVIGWGGPAAGQTVRASEDVTLALSSVALEVGAARATAPTRAGVATTVTLERTPSNVRVPRLVGLGLTDAADRAEQRGLEVTARDEAGNAVDLVFSRFYEVVHQSLRRGTRVVTGHTLEVVVRERADGC